MRAGFMILRRETALVRALSWPAEFPFRGIPPMSCRNRAAVTLILRHHTSGETPHLYTVKFGERALAELSHEIIECLTTIAN
jgi:hypothetical protein